MKQLQLNFEQAAREARWQERIDVYAGLSEVEAWRLHLQEVQQRFAFGTAPEREVEYIEARLNGAMGNQQEKGNGDHDTGATGAHIDVDG